VSDIFREIDEELRRENFFKLWQRYGKYVVALAVALVIVTAGMVGWRQYRLQRSQTEGVRYASALALAQQGQDKAAADAFGAMAHEVHGGRGVLARLQEAALRAKDGDAAAAIALYDQVAQDGSVEPVYRDAATLLAGRYGLDTEDPKAVIARLAPLTDAANPWHATALELTALAQLKAGDKDAARQSYQKLADDLSAPQGARARAAEVVAALAQ
jgi:hypothetical protein